MRSQWRRIWFAVFSSTMLSSWKEMEWACTIALSVTAALVPPVDSCQGSDCAADPSPELLSTSANASIK